MKYSTLIKSITKSDAGIFLIWLLHLSGLIGILAGEAHWFIPKTPLNLLLSAVLLLWLFPVNTTKKIGLFCSIFLVGFAAEWIGVNYGYVFGSYSYGDHLGPKFGGVPLLIGVNWAVLSLSSASVSNLWALPKAARIFIGSALMVGLDYFMELLAPVFDFWTFEGGHPTIWNYICWFGLALIFQIAYQALNIRRDQRFCSSLLVAQFVFFILLSLFY